MILCLASHPGCQKKIISQDFLQCLRQDPGAGISLEIYRFRRRIAPGDGSYCILVIIPFPPPGTENFQMVRKVISKNFMSIYEHKIPNEKMIGYRNEIVDADIVRQGTFVFSQSAWRNQNSCLLIFKIIGIAFDSLYRMLNAIRF